MAFSDWNGLAAGSGVVGISLVAVIALSRRRTKRRAALPSVVVEHEPRRRIDVVAIDAPTPAPKRETKS